MQSNAHAADIARKLIDRFGSIVTCLDAKKTYTERQAWISSLQYKKIIIGTDTVSRGIRCSHVNICIVYGDRLRTGENVQQVNFSNKNNV